ncbi:transcription factor HES-7 [Strigops habroptila]|uniref:transcription factor HES-7 n=1 Tax=Strigops habroptila TaxID=2489341 RepID=UPI0014025AD1|nr:transcription factor HES-7 [Strigops habroptila]
MSPQCPPRCSQCPSPFGPSPGAGPSGPIKGPAGPPPGQPRPLTMSSASEPGLRQLLKPLLEKRRRDRMNRSLDQLRLLLLAATRDERLRSPKVPKAEILRQTVQLLQAPPPADPQGTEELFLHRYHCGYWECLTRAARFLMAIPTEPPRPAAGPTALCPTALCPTPFAADPPGPPGCHGQPIGPSYHHSYHGYAPGYHSFRPRPDRCPGDGCHGDRSKHPGYHGYGPGLEPTSGPTIRPGWGQSRGPQHGLSPSGREDSQQRCPKEEMLPGPPHHVWRPWP